MQEIYWQAADGSGIAEQLTEGSSCGHAPDRSNGRRHDVALHGRRSAWQTSGWCLSKVRRRQAHSSWQLLLDERSASVSPDGQWLAYES